jgi:hypothetical protein
VVLGLLDINDNLTLMIANKTDSTVNDGKEFVVTIDEVNTGYEESIINETSFYKQVVTERNRYEDVIEATYNGLPAIYNCSQGLGRFDALLSIMMIGDMNKIRSDIFNSVKVSEEDCAKYTVCVGNRL